MQKKKSREEETTTTTTLMLKLINSTLALRTYLKLIKLITF